MTNLYRIEQGRLRPISRHRLASEDMLENWIVENPMLIGLDILIVGRQVVTDFKGRIDILGIDREGSLVVVELKRSKTPRDVVAQTLDYASWVASLSTKKIAEIAMDKLGKRLELAFSEHFETPLPETLNGNHSMVIVASELDASSKRIVEYLAEEHDLSINTVFFNVFEENGQELLTTDWLMDQQEVIERSESRQKLPWTGYYYVNAGEGEKRSWADMRRYGFISAGGGRFYSKRLEQLSVGDKIYVYERGKGYVGFGIVNSTAELSSEFNFPNGQSLSDVDLVQPNLLHDQNDPELSEYIVGVNWEKAIPISEAKTFTGVFANQNVVCKLRDPATLEFLAKEFGS